MDGSLNGSFVCESAEHCRITSYNVCYTKLLRKPPALPGEVEVLDREMDNAVVLSFRLPSKMMQSSVNHSITKSDYH